MPGFCLRRGCLRQQAALIGLGWLLLLFFLVGFSRSLSTDVVSVSKDRLSRRSAVSAIAANSNNENENDGGSCIPHYKWLIVGGGIHGVGIAARLVGEGKIDLHGGSINNNLHKEQLLVVDEHPALLYSWKARTRATGMAFLRSSVGFHLDVPAQGLKEFAGEYKYHAKGGTNAPVPKTRKKKPSKKDLRKAKHNRNKQSNPGGIFVESDYQRPALELFNDHCDLVVNKYGLDDCFFRGRVESIRCCTSHSNSNESSLNKNGNKAAPARVVIRTGSDAPATTTVTADNIVLAVGNDDPLFPEWATDLVSESSNTNHKISHILQISDVSESSGTNIGGNNGDSNDETGRPRVVAIVGGGISAVHKALHLTSVDNINNKKSTNKGNGNGKQSSDDVVVHIVSRHHVREQQFDTHQDWMMTDELAKRSLEKGGKGLTERQTNFRTLDAPAERREVIKRERIPGTVPTYMTRAKGGLEEAMANGKIHWHVAGVVDANANGHAHVDIDANAGENKIGYTKTDGRYQLNLTNGNGIIADEIILATGLGKRPPGHGIIHPLAEQAGLPLSPCGYPLVDPSLQWKQKHHGDDDGIAAPYLLPTSSKIYVSGGLAELELGPSARNIAGARMAAERIAASA